MSDYYKARGVSHSKTEVKAAIKELSKGLYPGAFCKIEEDIAGDENYCYIFHADGAGTKSSIAYLRYKESGDASVFRGIAQDSFVMNSDDLLAVGALGPFYLSNTIGRNSHRIPGEVIAELIAGYSDIAELLNSYGLEVVLTGGETADIGDLVQTVVCDSSLAVRMSKEKIIDASQIGPGQVIVGLAAHGQTIYEKCENSGIASNGLTAARHLLLSNYYRNKYPESYASSLAPELAYTGKYRLEDKVPNSKLNLGEAIQSPCRTYLPVLKDFLSDYQEEIFGIIHNTGGALTKVLNFGRDKTLFVKDQLFDRPPIFELISDSGQISEREMYQVFNLGQLMEIYCTENCARKLIKHAAKYACEAKIIGYTEVCKEDKSQLIIKDRGREEIYEQM